MLTAVTILVALALAVLAFFYFAQRAMLFPHPSGYASPQDIGLEAVREVPFDAADGTSIMMWLKAPAAGQPTILHFHGNAEKLPMLAGQYRAWTDDGWGLATMTYRSYPGSAGSPSEEALIADGVEAFDLLTREHGIARDTIILSGLSLGTAVAVAVAEQRPPRAMLLAGSMSAIVDVAARHLPFLPVRPLMHDRFPSAERLARTDVPVFFVHGTADRVVPIRFARALYDVAPGPKAFHEVPGGHVLPPQTGFEEFRAWLRGL